MAPDNLLLFDLGSSILVTHTVTYVLLIEIGDVLLVLGHVLSHGF